MRLLCQVCFDWKLERHLIRRFLTHFFLLRLLLNLIIGCDFYVLLIFTVVVFLVSLFGLMQTVFGIWKNFHSKINSTLLNHILVNLLLNMSAVLALLCQSSFLDSYSLRSCYLVQRFGHGIFLFYIDAIGVDLSLLC